MQINNAQYEKTAVKPEQYPVSDLPEIAFAGRSNVGKSSIINTLLGRKNLARVGKTPGKTREINFYNVDGKLYLVDLPGYGFANVSKEKKESWYQVIETYLYTRKQLTLIIMIVDIRHTPTQDDQTMYQWISSHSLKHLVLASKADKIPRGHVKDRLQDIMDTLGIAEENRPIPVSTQTKVGKEEVWKLIDEKIGVMP